LAYSEGIGNGLDPIDGVFELHQAYQAANSNYTGRVTVPTLWDKQKWIVVNNESAEIIRMLTLNLTSGATQQSIYIPKTYGRRSTDIMTEFIRPE